MGKRNPAALPSNISGPQRLARYTGTKGSTQGDKKDKSPAPKAIKAGMCSITYSDSYLMLIDLGRNIKLRTTDKEDNAGYFKANNGL